MEYPLAAAGLGDGPRDHLGLVEEVPPRTSGARWATCREEVATEVAWLAASRADSITEIK
jgi:hypothetical protein